MKKKLFAGALASLMCCAVTFAQTGSETANAASGLSLNAEVESLKRRVAELEARNREMLALLRYVTARMDAPATAVAVATSTTSATSGASGAATPDAPTVKWNEVLGKGGRIKLYGFVRVDLSVDGQRTNNGQIPQFVLSPDPRLGGKDGLGNFSISHRHSRIGLEYVGPAIESLGNAKTSGLLEIDFQGAGVESRPLARLRHAYFKFDWDHASLLGGQWRDLVSPYLPAVNQTGDMNFAGNVGDRRPQMRFEWRQRSGGGEWQLGASAGLTDANTPQDLDNDGVRDGEESGLPNLQARIGYKRTLWVDDQPATIGFGWHHAWFNTTKPFLNRTDFSSDMGAVDVKLPLTSHIDLTAEAFWGHALADMRGGIAQNINLQTGRDIHSRGGWVELGWQPSKYYRFVPGFTVDDPVDGDLASGARTRNRVFWLGQRITPSPAFTIGFDLLRWRTDYKGFRRGVDNRTNIFFQYNF